MEKQELNIEKQKLEIAQLKVEMKEEELELKTQMEISDARCRILQDHNYDQFECHGSDEQQSQQHTDINIPRISTEKEQPVGATSGESKDINQPIDKTQIVYKPVNICTDGQVDATHGDIGVIYSVVQQLRKPPPDIQRFAGDPLEYQRFKRQFQIKIVENSDSVDEKMSYLEQFTTGEALKIVKGCSYLDARRGYRAAWLELEDRYGNEEVVASALVKRALSWPHIRTDNPKSLDEYAIFLQECLNAVSTITAVKILEYPDNLRKLVMKLPYFYHERWRNNVLHVRDSGRLVDFHDLVSFVKREAKKATDPMFGKDALKAEDKSKPPVRKPAATSIKPSFSTDVLGPSKPSRNLLKPPSVANVATPVRTQNEQGPCIYCDDLTHSVGQCKRIISKPHMERLSFLRSKGLCFRCLNRGHMSKGCVQKVVCSHCGGNHQSILHVDRNTEVKVISACSELANIPGTSKEAGNYESTLAIIPVKVGCRNGLTVGTTYAFLDPGSTVSFCSEDLMNRLGCSGKKMEITIDTMGHPHTSIVQAVNGLQVYDLGLKNVIPLPTVYSREQIPVSNKHIPTSFDASHWPHLADIRVPEIDAKVELLIGSNVPDAYSPLEIRTGPQGSPHATRTQLGWVLWNVMRAQKLEEGNRFPSMKTEIAFKNAEEISRLDKMVKESMNFDFPERNIDDKNEMSQEDKEFIIAVSKSIHKQEGHYEIKLPFRRENVVMPDNSVQALHRLNGLKKKLSKHKKFHEDYKVFMKDILDKGYAEKVPVSEIQGTQGKVWYIPHHGVYHPRKPEKIRVVFDCTVGYQGVSLNSMLLQGPNLTNNLLGMLLRFRQENIAVMGDIQAMYYQVRVPREDCDFLRFYWWPDGDYTQEPQMYRMLVHLFGAVSSSSCATFALQQAAKDHKDEYDPDITNMIKENFYVDDYLATVQDETQAVRVVKEVTDLCHKYGFRLTKWISNSHDVMKSIPSEERAKDVKQLNLDCGDLPSERALGVFWFVESDTLGFQIQSKHKPNTKRGILSIVSSIYDPLGFIAPFVLHAKQLLQCLQMKQYAWDQEIDDASRDK
ncbi:uncharacterized protein LOC124260894 [Haliotis rubra]|uniref:uncharacterized protein LOC124260894 n=1 Tax=Haliotis rubra TaxID=36100 RepID=UPI001EE606BC|nr:uncharacterized protein LOC124260894 [Haliotis rubra]